MNDPKSANNCIRVNHGAIIAQVFEITTKQSMPLLKDNFRDENIYCEYGILCPQAEMSTWLAWNINEITFYNRDKHFILVCLM